MRGPAPVAQTLYRETDESKEARRKAAEERKAFMHYTPAPPSAVQTRPPANPQISRRPVT